MTIADFITDVNSETNRKAERIVLDALRNHFGGRRVVIRDLRDLHLKWDFAIVRDGKEFTLDVKCDHYIEATGRFAFEMFHIFDGGDVEPSWGSNPRVDYIAVIPDTFRYIKVFPLQYVRSYVAMMQRLHTTEALIEHRDWREIAKKNRGRGGGWTTYGWAVPIAGIESFCERMKASITTIATPPNTHRSTGPRLLFGGKEVA